jgi:hypothetical protein
VGRSRASIFPRRRNHRTRNPPMRYALCVETITWQPIASAFETSPFPFLISVRQEYGALRLLCRRGGRKLLHLARNQRKFMSRILEGLCGGVAWLSHGRGLVYVYGAPDAYVVTGDDDAECGGSDFDTNTTRRFSAMIIFLVGGLRPLITLLTMVR